MDTLLIVEDEPATRRYLKSLVQESGVPVGTIMECDNGDAAFQIVQKYRVDAMFTGIDMPGMDGLELVRRVHELARPPLTVVITDSDDLLHVVQMMRNGAQEYVLKPIERERMNEILGTLEAKWQENRKYSQTVRRLAVRMVFGVMQEQGLPEEEMAILRELYKPFLGELNFVVCAFQGGVNIKEQGKLLLFQETDDGCVCVLDAKNLRPFLQSELRGGAAGISGSTTRLRSCFAPMRRRPRPEGGRSARGSTYIARISRRARKLRLPTMRFEANRRAASGCSCWAPGGTTNWMRAGRSSSTASKRVNCNRRSSSTNCSAFCGTCPTCTGAA